MYDKRHVDIQPYGFYNKLPLRRFTFYASIGAVPKSVKVPKNGQQKTCNLFCNIAAKRVE